MRKRFRPLLTSLLFSLGLACLVEHRIFFDPTALNDDVRNQVYWMARLLNPYLFPHDYIADYFSQPFLVSRLVFGLYSLFSPWISPLLLSQFLPLALVVLATFFLFRFCANERDETYAAWIAFSFNAAIWIIKNLAGGLPRAFFYPLFFCLLWAIQTRRWLLVAVTLWLSGLIYPSLLVLGLGVFLFEIIRTRRDAPDFMPKIKCLAVSLIGLAVATTWRLSFAPAMKIFGAITNAATADQMRDFYLGGRVVLFPVPYPPEPLGFPLNLIMGVIQRLPHWYILIPVLVFGLLFWLYHHFLKAKLGSLPLPRMIWRTLIVSCICYALAWPLLFYLYVPERYLEYTFLLVPVFMLGGLPYLLQKRYPAQQGRIAAGFIALTILATSFAWRSDLMKIPSRERLLYSYLKTLPEDAMIAATPALASNIPLYAFRSVLLSNEAYIPFHQGYFKEMKARLRDWLQAYYATDAAPVAALIAQYDIDYIIIQAKDFKPDRLQELPRRHYYAFENSFFTALIQPDVNAYWLLNRPQACTLYDTNALRVLDAHCLLRS